MIKMSSRPEQHYFSLWRPLFQELQLYINCITIKKNASKADYGVEMDRTIFQRE